METRYNLGYIWMISLVGFRGIKWRVPEAKDKLLQVIEREPVDQPDLTPTFESTCLE